MLMGWPDVGLAFIAALPGMLAAYWAYRVSQAVHTNSNRTLGQHVEAIESTVNSRDTLVLDTAHIVTVATAPPQPPPTP